MEKFSQVQSQLTAAFAALAISVFTIAATVSPVDLAASTPVMQVLSV